MRATTLTGLAVLLVAATTGGAMVLRRPAALPQPAGNLALAVVREREFTPRVLASGNISLLPGARIAVGARVSGVVVSLPVTLTQEGDDRTLQVVIRYQACSNMDCYPPRSVALQLPVRSADHVERPRRR